MKKQETNWAELLSKAVATKDKLPPGDGWMTAKQLSKANSFGLSKVQRGLSALVAEGKVERFEGIESGQRNFWYREINSIQKNKRQLNGVIL